ncbi:Hypothetical predicted protein [Podarcis lilfordi]|uniref:Uncharacterized protein n=1 Tax=Podarcis lilfordi TaxID=74358 RepID=A0AA35JSU6_9SAUR|nr:Hypothetical predicted protein [Podarcis lilfordi]
MNAYRRLPAPQKAASALTFETRVKPLLLTFQRIVTRSRVKVGETLRAAARIKAIPPRHIHSTSLFLDRAEISPGSFGAHFPFPRAKGQVCFGHKAAFWGDGNFPRPRPPRQPASQPSRPRLLLSQLAPYLLQEPLAKEEMHPAKDLHVSRQKSSASIESAAEKGEGGRKKERERGGSGGGVGSAKKGRPPAAAGTPPPKKGGKQQNPCGGKETAKELCGKEEQQPPAPT